MIEYNKRNIRTWSMLGPSGTLGQAACELAETDENFIALTADLCFFSGFERLKSKYPDRLYNVGIAEQNMIGIAAGLAKEGFHVFATTYASFASARVMDQVKLAMGYMKLPIKLVGLTSGMASGVLGATHMALEDIAVMRALPGITILSPADGMETMKAVLAAGAYSGPVYLRLAGGMRTKAVYNEDYEFQIGRAVVLREGRDIAILSTGTMTAAAAEAAAHLEEKGISCEVMHFHTIKPLDKEAVEKACGRKLIVTIEEHAIAGGFGSEVGEFLAEKRNKPPQLMIGCKNEEYPHAASYESLLEQMGLTAGQIERRIMEYYER